MAQGNGNSDALAKLIAAIGASALAADDVVGALARRNRGETLEVDGLALLPDLIRLIPETDAFNHGVLPIHRSGDLLVVAVPPDRAADDSIGQLQRRLDIRVAAIAVTEIDVRGVLVKARQLLERKSRPEQAAPAPVKRDAAAEERTPDALGIPDGILRRLRKILAEPQGLLLVAGPRRSGKSTTLRALSGELRKKGLRTAEISSKQGVTAVEDALREDPDVLALDEPTGPAVASRLVRAAVEGRRVLLASRAPNAASALAQLADHKVDAHLVASAARAGLTQRAMGRVCDDCAGTRPEDPALLEDLRLGALLGGIPLRRGKGCPACGGTGLRGTVVLFEFGERGRDGVLREGFQPMIADALGKLLAGRITLRDLADQVPFTQLLQAADRLNVRRVNP
ncbi:MAG TPA: ATPase, T2SS/T4P/T4SS family [Planctomycetota bacterium]|nr:ATPase, T2SS/T4P/T4SS family [Planctomycetota bacterium]